MSFPVQTRLNLSKPRFFLILRQVRVLPAVPAQVRPVRHPPRPQPPPHDVRAQVHARRRQGAAAGLRPQVAPTGAGAGRRLPALGQPGQQQPKVPGVPEAGGGERGHEVRDVEKWGRSLLTFDVS